MELTGWLLIFVVAFFGFCALFIIRALVCWWFRINEIVEYLEAVDTKLERLITAVHNSREQ